MTNSRKPNLFIVGAAKAGTTTLYAAFSRSNDVFMCNPKEPHFFAPDTEDYRRAHLNARIRDRERYEALFKRAGKHPVIGEASTSYLHHYAYSAPQIREYSPDSKVIISLRDPVERAYSHYLMDRRAGIEERPFAQALNEDFVRNRPLEGAGLYVDMGFYSDAVEKYLRVFGEKNVYVTTLDELSRSPTKAAIELGNFLGLGDDSIPPLRPASNSYAVARGRISGVMLQSTWAHRIKSFFPPRLRGFIKDILQETITKPPMPAEARSILQEAYWRDIERLGTIIGHDVTEDLRRRWTPTK